LGDQPPFVQQEQPVGEPRGQVEIVHHTHHHQLLALCQRLELAHELQLVVDVEEAERLVEQEIPWRAWEPDLRQDSREVHALLLATAERQVVAVGHRLDVEEAHHLVADPLVRGGGPPLEVRIAAHRHHFSHAQRKCDLHILGKDRAHLRERVPGKAPDVCLAVADVAGIGAHLAPQHLQERRLPRAVRPDDQMQPPRLEARRHGVDDAPSPHLPRDLVGDQHALTRSGSCGRATAR